MTSRFLNFSFVIHLLGLNIDLGGCSRLILVDAYGDEVLFNTYETKKFIQVTPSSDYQEASFQISLFVSYNGRDWSNNIRSQGYKANAQFVAGYNTYDITMFGRSKTILAKYQLQYSFCPDAHDICQRIVPDYENSTKILGQKFCVIQFNHSSLTTEAKHTLITNLTVEFGSKSSLTPLCKAHGKDTRSAVCSNVDSKTKHFEYSVCKVYGDGERPLYIVANKTTCENNVIHFSNHGIQLFIGDYHLMSDLAHLKIICDAQKVEICQKRHNEKTCIDGRASSQCNEKVRIHGVSHDRLFVTKLIANSIKQASTYIFVVNLAFFNPVKPEVRLDESGSCELTCKITNIKSFTGHFRFKYTMFDDVHSLSSGHITSLNASANIFRSDVAYACMVEVRFRVCSPFTEFYTVGYSSKVFASRCEVVSEVTVKKSSFSPATGIVYIGTITIVWAICILLLLILRSRKFSQKPASKKPSSSEHSLLK